MHASRRARGCAWGGRRVASESLRGSCSIGHSLTGWVATHAAGARLVGYVNAQLTVLGMQREPTEQWGYDRLMTALHEQLSDADIEKLAAEGAAWSEDQAVEEALKV